MGLRLVGAGLGRTGTLSLKAAVERLTGGRCYHMLEVFGRPDDVPVWRRATRGELPDWNRFLAEFTATVDWPAAAFWREISQSNPDALVLLSVRESPETWWHSAEQTIVDRLRRPPDAGGGAERREWISELLTARFTARWGDRDGAIEAYRRHNDAVRTAVAPGRLVEWRPGDGWEPLCAALGEPVPDEPFPHLNSTAEFRAFTSLDAGPEEASSE